MVIVAGPDAAQVVTALGAVATICLVVALASRRPEPIAAGLALLGAAYALILVIDKPDLDGSSAIVGATLLASRGARSPLGRDPSGSYRGGGRRRPARRIRCLAGAVALGLGAAMLALADLLRTDGIAIEVVGVAAAAGAVGLLVAAASEARRNRETVEKRPRLARSALGRRLHGRSRERAG